jgi:hypothetical protein
VARAPRIGAAEPGSVVRPEDSGAENAFISTTRTTTIDADGVPTVTEDGVSVDCLG